MKRIIICFDGTWNRIDAEKPTNVLTLATGIAPKDDDGNVQAVYYDEGVGTSGGWARRRWDGATGNGVERKLADAYKFLMFNYEPQDQVFVFGFSRGAFTARSFMGLVRCIGIIERPHVRQVKLAVKQYVRGKRFDSQDMLVFRAKYSSHISTCGEDETHRCETMSGYQPGSSLPFKFRYAGLWDTVETLGLGKVIWAGVTRRSGDAYRNRDHSFHDHALNGILASGRHAVALDERRHHFHSEPWGDITKYNERLDFGPDDPDRPIQELFFPGDHGSVGGGGDITGLSDGAFDWVLDGAKDAGLDLDDSPMSKVFDIRPNYRASLRNSSKPPKKLSLTERLVSDRSHRPAAFHQVHESTRRRWAHGGEDGSSYRPATLTHLSEELDGYEVASPLETKFMNEAQASSRRPLNVPSENLQYYTVVKGDTLSKIAKRFLGDSRKSDHLFDINRGTISDPDKIFVGQVIRLPETSDDAAPDRPAEGE